MISTSRNVDQQCTMTLSSSPSPPFYRKGEYPAKRIRASLRGSQALVLDSVPFCTAPCWASSGKDVVQLHAVIKPCAVRFSRPLGEGQGSAQAPAAVYQLLDGILLFVLEVGWWKVIDYRVKWTFHFPREWLWLFHFPRESDLTFGVSVSYLKSGAYVTSPRILRPWCWGRLKAKEEGGGRGWDWLFSLTQWTWIWANSRIQWRTGKPGVL